MAITQAATALAKAKRGPRRSSNCERPSQARIARVVAVIILGVAPGLMVAAAPAAAAKARITGLTDVAFGTIANLSVDAIRSQNVCVYSTSSTSGYNVTASGSGPGGAFQLSSGTQSLPFEVQWSSSTGQSSGTQLAPNVPLTGQVSSAAQQTCNSGPTASASLVVLLRSSSLSSATAGTYNGTLTLVVGPE